LPPSTGITAPVTHDEASEARKIAAPLMSSGWPKRPAGMPPRNVSRKAGTSFMRAASPWFMTCAGTMQFTRTPRPAHSVLSSRVIWMTAAIAMP
jgi:hypothetical protein